MEKRTNACADLKVAISIQSELILALGEECPLLWRQQLATYSSTYQTNCGTITS